MPGSDIVFINGMTTHAGLVDGLAMYGVPRQRVRSGDRVDRGARHDNHRHGDPGHAYVREEVDRTHVRCSLWLQEICQASAVSVNASDRGCARTTTLVTPSIRASWSPGTFSGPGPGPSPGAGCGYAVERAV